MMRVFAISDLHGYLPAIPPCDLLLLGGDYHDARDLGIQKRYMEGEFRDWLLEIPARYIVGIAGNYDFIAEQEPELMKKLPWIYLQDEMVNIEGVRIYGTPYTPEFGHWAFMRSGGELAQIFSKIPEGLDILLSHGPAHGRVDRTTYGENVGSRTLLERIREVIPDSLVCGHIHEARGMFDDGATRHFNVSHVNVRLEPLYGPVYIPLRVGAD